MHRQLTIEAAFARAELEIERAASEDLEGNHGKARVCARRAVQAAAESTRMLMNDRRYGDYAMETLRMIADDRSAPREIQAAAYRLLHGIRAEGTPDFPSKPVEDAKAIVAYLRRMNE